MKLLACSDGSEAADQAMRAAAALAAACRADVTLLGILETTGHSKPIMESLSRAQAQLESRRVRTELVTRPGKPVEEIALQVRQQAYDLVVIGAHRRPSHGLYWVSSKAYKLIKEILPPVLVVTGKYEGIKRILVCSGGKRYIDHALELAGTLARGLGASVTLLHVTPEVPGLYSQMRGMEETLPGLLNSQSELGLNLREGKALLEGMGVPTEAKLRKGPVLGEILGELIEGGHDLVVTGSAMNHSLTAYALGDISREVVNRSTKPVLVARTMSAPAERPLGLKRWFGKLAGRDR